MEVFDFFLRISLHTVCFLTQCWTFFHFSLIFFRVRLQSNLCIGSSYNNTVIVTPVIKALPVLCTPFRTLIYLILQVALSTLDLFLAWPLLLKKLIRKVLNPNHLPKCILSFSAIFDMILWNPFQISWKHFEFIFYKIYSTTYILSYR